MSGGGSSSVLSRILAAESLNLSASSKMKTLACAAKGLNPAMRIASRTASTQGLKDVPRVVLHFSRSHRCRATHACVVVLDRPSGATADRSRRRTGCGVCLFRQRRLISRRTQLFRPLWRYGNLGRFEGAAR